MKRWLVRVLVVLVLLVAGVLVVGLTRPEAHVAVSSARFVQPRDVLWAAISDLEGQAGWRAGVERVERLPDRDGLPVYMVHAGRHSMPLVVAASEPPRLLRVETPADAGLPFHGSWTWQLSEADGGTSVTIIEDGAVPNPFFRGLATVMGYHATMDAYLVQLGRRFGEEVVPRPIPQAVPR